MKKDASDNRLEIIAFFVSVLTISLMLLTFGAGRISYAAASIVFYAGRGYEGTQNGSDALTAPVYENSPPEKTEITDITRTPSDIEKLMEHYKTAFAEDVRDGDIQASTYIEKGATHIYENVRVRNTTETKTLNIERVLSEGLELKIDKSKPAVLIFHSHTSEGYEMIEREWYAQGYTARSNDENINVVRVGTEIADYLEGMGYTVIHDKTIHDDNYSDSYPNSRKTVAKHLEEHPEIQIVIDIHRDSIALNNGTKIKPLNIINGKKAAQLMIITGAEEGKVENFPDWEYNLRFALQLQKECETLYPGLMRPVLFSQRKYNMDMTRFSLLIEMGSEANTLEEACYSGRMLASALGSLMDRYVV
ncbi:MAG: stage II sporulation protein P [Clostridia bacterium]|nr:stage II sporulation protein P [Clostridia bacterium]